MTTAWTRPTTAAEAIARARGRTKYNRTRHLVACLRRVEVLRLYMQMEGVRGARSRIARMLGVDRSTVTRDLQVVLAAKSQPCPTCRTEVSNRRWKGLAHDAVATRGLDPRSVAGQAEIRAAEVVNEILPRLLGDLGFFVGDEGALEDEDGRPLPDSAPSFREVATWAQEALRVKGAA